MRKVVYSLLVFGALTLAGCTLPKMVKMSKEQQLTVTPNPLEVHKDTVAYDVAANLPVKMLKKGTSYTVNSFYKYGDKELALDPIPFKAEDYPNSSTGLITTSKLVKPVYFAAFAGHGYNNGEELVPVVIPDLIFEQGRSVLRTSEIKSTKGKELDAFIASKNATRTVTITGTHSPEGAERINGKLSPERAAAIEKFYRQEMKK